MKCIVFRRLISLISMIALLLTMLPAFPVCAESGGAPTQLTATSDRGTVTLSWTGTADAVKGYNLYRGTSPGGESRTPVSDFLITTTQYTDANVESSMTYYYVCRAVYADGTESANSNEVSVLVRRTSDDLTTSGSGSTIVLWIGNPYMSIDGVRKEIDPGRGTAPMIVNGRTMLPIRSLIETLGGTVAWSASDQKLTIVLNGKTLEMWVGSKVTHVNGSTVTTDIAPQVINGRTMVPLRYVIDNLGYSVVWDSTANSITISTASMGQTTSTPATTPGSFTVYSLPNVWTINEGGVWAGVWTRRGSSDVFDAVWTNSSGQRLTDVLRIVSVTGNQVRIYRTGTNGYYTGTLSADGTRITNGTCSWVQGNYWWNGTLSNTPPPPVSTPMLQPVNTVDSLGGTWEVNEAGIWIGKWTRQGSTNMFNATWTNVNSGETLTDTLKLESVKGNVVRIYRYGTKGYYTGTLSSDGTRVTAGSVDWVQENWTAKILP